MKYSLYIFNDSSLFIYKLCKNLELKSDTNISKLKTFYFYN
ncbi:hypothetical protein ACJA29_03775 [Metamycoplasma sualvi]